MDDKDYRAEADKRGLPVGRALSGAELHKLIVTSLSVVPDRVAKEYMAFAGHQGRVSSWCAWRTESRGRPIGRRAIAFRIIRCNAR